jgi:hypothetical protein
MEQIMKVKLNKKLVKKYWFHLGGDMSETMGIAVNGKGEAITYLEFRTSGGVVKPIELDDLEEDFLVVNHERPIRKGEYERFKAFFETKE